jgi:hypothetical protein
MKKRSSLLVQALAGVNYKLLLFLAVGSLIPLLYSTFRIYWLGQIDDDSAFNIAAQVTWLSLLYEVLNEALLLPLAFILGQVIQDKMLWRERITVTLSLFLAVYVAVTGLFLIFAPNTVSFMHQRADLYLQTVQYIRLEAVAILFSSLFSYFQLVLILQNQRKFLYLLLILQSVLILILDGLLVSSLSFSLKLGLTGIALCNIAVSLVLAGISCVALYVQGVRFHDIQFRPHLWLKDYYKKAAVSCIESGIRNIVFALIILKMINMAERSGDFWLMNQFIWGWLLLPVFAIAQLVKQDAAIHQSLSSAKINAYLILMTGVIFAWLSTMPWWEAFIYHVMGIEHAQQITQLAIGMIGCYMLFAWNSVLDQYFYGIGRIDLILYQTIMINTLFYGAVYILYSMQFFTVTLANILFIFGLSLVLDSILTFMQYIWLQYLKTDRCLKVQ